MIDFGAADFFIGNRGLAVGEPVTLGQDLLRIFSGLHAQPMKHRRQDFEWSYEGFGNGIPDDIPD